MHITQLELIPVAFPDPPLCNSWGVHAPFALRTILRLHSEEGLVGLMEMRRREPDWVPLRPRW